MPKIILNGIDYANGIDQAKLAKIGDAALTTVAQDLSGAVNELKSNLSELVDYFDTNITIPASNSADTYTITFPSGHEQTDSNYSAVVENLGGNTSYIGLFTFNTTQITTTGFGGIVKNLGTGASASAGRPVRVYIFRN